jgi:WD40 repeat protein
MRSLLHGLCAIYIFFLSLSSYAQEVKLGLPLGHIGPIFSSVFSHNGKFVLTSSLDCTARLWDVETGKLLFNFQGHTNVLWSAEFSYNDELIITAGRDSTAKVWDVKSGKIIHTLKGHLDKVFSACFSPDGNRVLTASLDSTAIIWDSETGALLSVLKGHKDKLRSAEFSRDGKSIVTSSRDGTARIWNTKTGKQLLLMSSQFSSIYLAKFSPDGLMVITASNDNISRLWNVVTGQLINTLEGHTNLINSVVFSPDGKYILTSSLDSTAKIWKTRTGEMIMNLKGHNGSVNYACFSPDIKKAVTTSSDTTVRLWDLDNGAQIGCFRGHSDNLNPTLFSPDGKLILTSSEDFTANIWNVQSRKLLHSLNRHTKSLYCVRSSPDGQRLLTSSEDGKAYEWNFKNGKLNSVFNGHSNAVNYAEYSPDGKKVITSSWDSTAILWDTENYEKIRDLDGHSKYVFTAVFSADGSLILTASHDKTAKLWNSETGNLIRTFEGHSEWVFSASFNMDGSKVVTASWDGTAKIWNANNGELLLTVKSSNNEPVNSAVFSSDGKLLILSTMGNDVVLFNADNGNYIRSYLGHKMYVFTSFFSPDNQFILSASDDNSAIIWNIENTLIIHTLGVHTDLVRYANYSHDGKFIYTASGDGSYVIWNANTGEQLIRHFIFDSDPNKWVHIHPSGLFDASPEAMELMYWTKGLEVIEFAQLKDRYWVPGLWEKVMKGEPLPDARNMQELKLQPQVEFGEVKDGKIPVTLTKRDGGYGKVSILINGKEIQADARGSNFDKSKETQTIWVDLKDHPNLKDGENTIAVKASSEDGFVVGRPEEKKVTLSLQRTAPHFYAVVVGTGKYMNSSINLKYPEKDAQSMSTALKLGAEELFGADKTHIYTLTTAGTERPTKEKIKSVFTEIGKKATSSDIVLVYLSGHGIAWGGDQGDFYYVTTDATAANAEAFNDEVLRKNYTISTTEFTEYLKAIPANKQVMIIDACSSGKAVDNLMAARDIDVSSIKAIDRMKDRTGMFVISGSAADAVSYEASRYGQGLLTYSILQAMKGAALRDGEFFDVNTILNYSRENVPKLAAGIGGIQTPQLLVPKGGSFDIGKVDEEAKKQIPLSSIKPVFVRTSFMDTEAFADDLNLSKSIDEELNEIAMRGSDGQLVFLDTREFPDAYRLSGGYTQSNGTITLKLKIKGPKESEHQLSAKTKEELIEKVLEIVEALE